MVSFDEGQVVLLVRDIERTAAFYRALGFSELFRTPPEGSPIHVDLCLGSLRLGLATAASTRQDHDLDPVATGQRAVVVLWTDDVEAAFHRLGEAGGRPVHGPRPWLGTLWIAWAEDPDGHLVQVVQRVG